MDAIVFAQAGNPQAPPQFGFFFIILATFAVFYFILIRPQQRKQKELQKAIEALRKGDRILTNGGIFGTVVSLKDNILVLKIAEDVKVEVVKSAVASIVTKGESA